MIEPNHWGEWTKRRMRHVGFVRQIDLAASLDCSVNQLCRWLGMSTPPERICKGFDQKLADALRIDRITLFQRWRHITPEAAPLTEAQPLQDESHLRRKVLAIVELLGADQLREVHDHGRKLLAAVA